MGVVNINDRDCIRTYTYIKRKYDRACIQTDPQRLFEIKAYRAERGQSRKSRVLLSKSKSSDRDIHGSKKDY